MAGRGDHQHLVVAQVRRHQAGRQVRGLDEAEPRLNVPDELDDPGGVGHGELHDGRAVIRRLLGTGLLDIAQFDQPVRDEVLGDGLAGGDGQPVRHPGPDGPQPRLEPVGGVEYLLGPADDEPSLLGEVGAGRGAGEQRDAHGPLKCPHPGRQRLLRDAEHPGGGRDRSLPAHFAQRPQRAQVVHRLAHRDRLLRLR
jgi:hypothetical protein